MFRGWKEKVIHALNEQNLSLDGRGKPIVGTFPKFVAEIRISSRLSKVSLSVQTHFFFF